MIKYKDGIYEGDYGITYFIKDNRVLLTHLGNTYKASVLSIFGNWKYKLRPEMYEEFDDVYNKVKQW